VQGHNWFFSWTISLVFILSPCFFYFSPTTISLTHPSSTTTVLFTINLLRFVLSLLSLLATSSSPSRCQGTIQTASDNDCEDQIRVKVEIFVSKVLGKGELCPCTLLKITKMSFVTSMWHVPFVRSVKIDDRDQFC